MRPAFSLRSHIALLIALLVTLLSWLLGTLIGNDSSQRIREEVGRDLVEVSLQMIDRLDRDMASRAAYLQVLGSLNVLRQPDDAGQIRELLDRLKQEIPSIAWIGFTDPKGTVLAASGGILQGASLAQRPVYIQGYRGLFIGDVHEAVLLAKLLPNPSGEPMKFVDISLPVYGPNDKLAGVLATHLSWTWADEVRRSLVEPIQQRRNVEFLILGRDHTVLLGPKAMIGQRLELSALERPLAKDGQWAVQRWPDGQEYVTGFAASHGYQGYAGLGWIVVARQSLDEAYAPARALSRNIVLWGVGLALLFAATGWLLTGYFTRPLRQIAEAADRLSAGQIAEIPDLDSPREIAVLSQSIRQLVESLTHQQNALGLMENKAHSDPLTGLANRAALEKFLMLGKQREGCLALLYLDLDGFKPVNDKLGHAAGDQLLRHVAVRLRGCVRDGDMVARLGGDEFVLVLQVQEEEAQARIRHVAERVLHGLQQPVRIDEQEVRIGCSIGGALWPLDNPELESVLEMADQALYRAKHAGRNRAEFQDTAQNPA
ncbi:MULTISPECIES: sensor domain-containing diguanylate cyclase [unclassified Pseudomonas]|uniref:sensor domain-containing diguanylate cyclase n=1 Tax=unclassified Pseudomonas TaxID=196821 RepID=UPI00244ADAFC|nr:MULTISPECIES: sensor domain-containing diguanylate cyclase [unclassified Pseudomonas]MDG9924672.1 diguanylate cyclase [Pseudomonas sp. GD04045]MDH0033455.1 diguanylate cyclase [Pseudomonas sp. GD04019]